MFNGFFDRLNKARIDKELEKDKVVFDIIVDLLNFILTNLIEDPDKNHDDIKKLLILSQSFYINDEKNLNKKIFFSNKITTPKEFKTSEFWIQFIEKEIENNELIEKQYKDETNKENREIIKEEKNEKNNEDVQKDMNEKIEKEKIENKKEEKEEIKKENQEELKEDKREEIKGDETKDKEEKNEKEKEKEEILEEKKDEKDEKENNTIKIEENKEDIKAKDEEKNKKEEEVKNKIDINNRNKQNEVLMVFIGNISNLNDYLSNQSKMKEIFNHFDEKFKFSEENIKKVSDVLGFHIK